MEREVRKCNKHGLVEHYLQNGKRVRWCCNTCNSEAIYKRKYLLKAELVERAGGCCQRCGYNQSINALQFHHRDPATKSFGLGRMTSKSKSLILLEADKCDLLCANCHAEVEELQTHSSAVERLFYKQDVEGSNPSGSTVVRAIQYLHTQRGV
jgi:hypothetical protein